MLTFQIEVLGFALVLFGILIGMIELGRRLGIRQRASLMAGGASGANAIEAAIFALLGLLIAFTFQGAAARFDGRRLLVAEEANHIGTAWLRLDLLPTNAQPAIRASLRQYLDSRLNTYQSIPNLRAVTNHMAETARLQREIWRQAVAAEAAGEHRITVGVLPALNAMFDIVGTRTMVAHIHPPAIVFVMLVVMAGASAFLAGHGMSGSKLRSWVHTTGFAGILAFTVFVILDLEFPRLGIIRVDRVDQVLIDLRRSMD